MRSIELGLGLLSIGRQWGVNKVVPPGEEVAVDLIEKAYSNGVRFFDTAPAYGRSEEILGRAISSAHPSCQKTTIATKMGEHWDAKLQMARGDHSFDGLAKSIDNSMALLGRIDLLQLHKANTTNVASSAVLRAFDRAASMGVKVFGASVSDFDTAVLACKSGCYKYLQFPFNASNRSFAPIFEILAAHDMNAIVNRPFAMGALVQGDVEKSATKSFRSILDMGFSGIVLTGTSSVAHLLNNIKAFEKEIIRCG